MSTPNKEQIIRPISSWPRIDWRELYAYRDLIRLFVYRDFVARYKQTILGPLWFILQPLLLTIIFTIIFGKVAKIPTDGMPPFLFYQCGLLAWSYFSQGFAQIGNFFTTQAGIFSKVYFPRLTVPASQIMAGFLALGVQTLTFAGFWVYFRFTTEGSASFHLSNYALLFPLLLVQLAATTLGCGLMMACLTAKYRDLTQLAPILTQLWLYVTPVIYPATEVPDRFRMLVSLNPMAGPVEAVRLMFLGKTSLSGTEFAVSFGVGWALLIIGLFLFARVEKTFVDTV